MSEHLKPKDARVPVAQRDLFVLDVRPEEEWNENSERIPGSVHIPADELESRMDDLPEEQKILVVSPDGEHAAEAAEKIDGEGREVVVLEGGVEQWKKDGLMTQPSADPAPPKGEDEPPHEEPGDDEDDDEDEDEGPDGDDAADDEPAEGEPGGEDPSENDQEETTQ